MRGRPPIRTLLAMLAILLSGCAGLMSQATGRLADNLSAAILNQDDAQTVKDGAPAYLLLIDGLIQGEPDSDALLRTGATLYSAYATAFVEDPERVRKMTAKAREYALRALDLRRPNLRRAADGPFDAFAVELGKTDARDVPTLYVAGAAWAGWVQARTDDWAAIADLPKVRALMERVVALDEMYQDGGAHLYLGVLGTLLPPALGGKPEEGRVHFERAIELSGGRDLMAKAMYAESYARLVFDRALHDRLVDEVLAADPHTPGRTLVNTFAQARARRLKETADEYFPAEVPEEE